MQSTVEALEGNKVRLHVTVPADEFDSAIDAAFRKLAREVRIPGFRPGKAPRRLLEARFGTEAAREQALRDSVPEYYVAAVQTNDVDVIAMPEIEITAGADAGDVEFEAVVEVRPQVQLAGYDALRVEIAYSPVDDEAVDKQVDALRERFADLTDSELPLIDDAEGTFYFKGEGDRTVWLSPHDETDTDPCDAAPEEMDVAIAIDRFEQVVDWPIEAVERKWAGLRTFAPDRVPVHGYDPSVDGFFWCAGQGGFGIQTAPAAARLAAALLLDREPDAMVVGIDPRPFLPARFR